MLKAIGPVILLLLSCCKNALPQERPYFVYHIPSDTKKEDTSFSVCNENWILPYYGGTRTQYNEGKPGIKRHFIAGFTSSKESTEQTGYVTIRFIVNCNGQAGRFSVEEFDNNYHRISFDKNIVTQLLLLTKQLKSWVPAQYNEQPVDTYYYICFKLDKGQLKEIMP
jgi:hypothetical protein